MPERRIICRYLCESGSRCTGEAVHPDGEILLCGRHLMEAVRTLYGPGPSEDPQSEGVRKRLEAVSRKRQVFVDAMPEGEFVYYIKFGDRIKIGTTTNLKRRLSSLPYDELLVIESGGYGVESSRHRQFALDRITGEWFRPSKGLLQHIEKLRREAFAPTAQRDA